MTAPLLSVRGLCVDVRERGGSRRLIDGASFELARGEILGLVGESGSGKTLLSRAVVQLLPSRRLEITAGSVVLDGRDLTSAGESVLRTVRGRDIGMVFQNPTSHLDPVMRVGDQVAQSLLRHDGLRPTAARHAAIELLAQVGFADPARRYVGYPHEFSVGMRQRAMIAVALSSTPRILIADEPTSALDVTTQAQILRLLMDLRDRRGLAMVLISHDPAVVARTCDRVAVLRQGRIVEQGHTRSLLDAPRHPYTVVLVRSRPARSTEPFATPPPAPGPAPSTPLLEVADLEVRYRGGGIRIGDRHHGVVALKEIGLRVFPGESVGIVGESGSGKSTLARAVLGLIPITSGRIRFDGGDLAADRAGVLAALRRDAAMVFQDHDNALNPRLTVGQALTEVLAVRGRTARADIPARVGELLDLVALDRSFAGRKPRTMSGGECQRAGIARALAAEPRLLIADECVAGLDVVTQGQIVELLGGLRQKMGLTLLFIAHDLGIVRRLCERVVVLRQGEIVEEGPSDELFARPRHPHTAALIAASPRLEQAQPPEACPFLHDDGDTEEERYA